MHVGITVDEIVKRPFETESDSFYFVDDKLIMHNMAEYRYTENSIEAQGKANAEGPAVAGATAGGKTADGAAAGAGQKRNRGGSKFDDEEDEDEDESSKFSHK